VTEVTVVTRLLRIVLGIIVFGTHVTQSITSVGTMLEATVLRIVVTVVTPDIGTTSGTLFGTVALVTVVTSDIGTTSGTLFGTTMFGTHETIFVGTVLGTR
jgi:hypothetical protein